MRSRYRGTLLFLLKLVNWGGELERAIMARHGATGFGLRFAIEGGSLDSAKESYFDDLNRLSSGNVFAAIFIGYNQSNLLKKI